MHGWILGEVNEKQSLRVPIFSKITRVAFESFALSFLPGFFQSSTEFILKRPNRLSQVGDNVQKGRVVNIVSTSFTTIARQTTEKSQRKNRFLHCSVKKLMNRSKATF